MDRRPQHYCHKAGYLFIFSSLQLV